MLLLNLIPLIDVTFSTPTAHCTHRDVRAPPTMRPDLHVPTAARYIWAAEQPKGAVLT
jgi:hypothetical protein